MYESSSFVQYKAVNEAFADAVARVWKEGDVSEYSATESYGYLSSNLFESLDQRLPFTSSPTNVTSPSTNGRYLFLPPRRLP